MLSIHCNGRVKLRRNKKNLRRITKIKPFINKCNWEGINEKGDWKKFEKKQNCVKKYIYPAQVSKHNSNREKHVILLMILNEEKR